jgi:hypothetical protein
MNLIKRATPATKTRAHDALAIRTADFDLAALQVSSSRARRMTNAGI